ncbi:HDOD domain-containing protein [Pseudodesulfovibrio sp. F-1]|uniref:HDOD domain-containing protein n=1 Tax=Pseudodesulfovibrio alkaliphilus TaxID=2661613 RepID=A0A7K1KRS4_9BACT|nr:HDOD domain-containing protein [Pseudodesulfovibrio alkaliphilus]MUM78806.1 HDOD domain-containing protein [Pseudodesulfovibrio alkaliphilus]
MDDDLKTSVRGEILQVADLPTLPDVLEEVTRLVEDPDASTEAIAKVISRDQVLSAKVLKMVNSPIYGFPGRISSIQHALVLLGFNVIRGIIISTSVFDMMVQNMKGLWEHSLGCATACNIIARRAGFEDPEEYAVAGLLHDLGKVVTAVQLPDLHGAILSTVRDKDVTYLQAEKDVMGFGHDRINAWLARHWGLPPNIREAMARHHAPQLAEFYKPMACVVHLGDFLVRLFEFGNSGDDQTAYLRPEALLELNFKMSDLDKVMDEMAEQFIEVSDVTF